MDLSIIIVNWNSKDYLQKCIASILKWTNDVKYEILVIDSGSYDGTVEMLEQCYPQVRFIQSEINLGFAKANNAVFNLSSGRNILFLNPDTEFESPGIESLSHWLDSLPNAGIVGPRLLNSDGSVQTSCIQGFPTILNQLLDSDILRNAFPKSGMWGMSALFARGITPSEVDTVSGACLMIKRSVFATVRMFSTDYFMYSEDIDLCFKVREVGWKIYYIPNAVIVHHGGTSSSQSKVSAFSSVMMLESRWRFFKKTRSRWYCLFYRVAVVLGSMVRVGVISMVWPIYELRGKRCSVGNVMEKWYPRLRWALGGEGWVKDY